MIKNFGKLYLGEKDCSKQMEFKTPKKMLSRDYSNILKISNK